MTPLDESNANFHYSPTKYITDVIFLYSHHAVSLLKLIHSEVLRNLYSSSNTKLGGGGEMGAAYSTDEMRKPERTRLLGRPSHRWEDEIEWEAVN
jgi:hypothetical protein